MSLHIGVSEIQYYGNWRSQIPCKRLKSIIDATLWFISSSWTKLIAST